MADRSQFQNIIAELDTILMEKAAAEEARVAGNELAGKVLSNPKATSGAGDTQSDGHAEDETDQESPQTEQHSDPSRSVDYQNAPQQDSKDDAQHSGLNTEASKMARLSNDILTRIANIAGTTASTKQAEGGELATKVLSLLAKSAEDEEKDKDKEDKDKEDGKYREGENGEGNGEMSPEEREEAEAAGAASEEEKRSYVMSKRAGAAAADALFTRLQAVQQAEHSKQAGYIIADHLIKKSQAEQAQALDVAIKEAAAKAVAEKTAADVTAPAAPWTWNGRTWDVNPSFYRQGTPA